MKTLSTAWTTLSECDGLILIGAHQSCSITSLPLLKRDRKSNENLMGQEEDGEQITPQLLLWLKPDSSWGKKNLLPVKSE